MSPFLEKWMPPRWNEVLGLQHIKGYAFDKSNPCRGLLLHHPILIQYPDIIFSGANLNHDYFTNRQDRYLMVKDSQEVSDFFSDLVSHISAFSHSLQIPETPKGASSSLYLLSPPCKSKNPIEMGSSFKANQYQDWVARTKNALDSGTHLIPAIQMGLSNTRQEEKVFEDLFKVIGEKAPNYRIDMSSAYLNFPTRFQDMVIESPCRVRILTSAPQANGFYGAKNMSGYLPDSYTYLESRLMEKLVKAGRQTDVQLFEYHRPGWTFHAKGESVLAFLFSYHLKHALNVDRIMGL